MHEEGGVAVAGDAALQAVVEMQFTRFDNAFEAIVANGAGAGLFDLAEGKVVGGEEGETVVP